MSSSRTLPWMLLALWGSVACRTDCAEIEPVAVGNTELEGPLALWREQTHLRGANVWQRLTYPDLDGPTFMGPGELGPPMLPSDFERLAAAGANYVNLSHPGLFTEDPPYEVNQAAVDNLDQLVQMAADADLFVVITARTGPGRSEFWAYMSEDSVVNPDEGWFDPSYYNHEVWTDAAAQQAWAEMWRFTAERYRDQPHVVGYDLMCEPNPEEIFFDIWQGPESFYPEHAGEMQDWNALYPRLLEAIREVDPVTPVLVQPMSYASLSWLSALERTSDQRTVYTVHEYEPMVYTHQQRPLRNHYPGRFDTDFDDVEEVVDRAWIDGLSAQLAAFSSVHDVPVASNEFGVIRWQPGAADYLDDRMASFDEHGINHAIWDWATSWEPFQVNDDFNFQHGTRRNHHTNASANPLMCVVQEAWSKNELRPSNVSFSNP